MEALICPASCYVLTNENEPIMSDASHFSQEGARFLWSHGGSRLFGFIDGSENAGFADHAR
jgi:hypothetical protein